MIHFPRRCFWINFNSCSLMRACNFCTRSQIKCPPRRIFHISANLDSLVVLHANVARARNQHDAHILQRAFDYMHVLVQVAGRRLGGVRQEGILEVHAQSLREEVVPKCQPSLVKESQIDWLLWFLFLLIFCLYHIFCSLTVLMFTLMTGIRDLHDEVGSGLSAFMFTLQEQ